MSIASELEAAKAAVAPRHQSKVGKYLRANPKQRKLLDEALEWFATNRTTSFGWRQLSEYLRAKDPAFPPGYQHLSAWARENRPDLSL